MRFVPLALLLLVPAAAPPATPSDLKGPKSLLIGAGTGAVRAAGYAISGFNGGPVVSVHTKAPGVRVRDIEIAAGGSGFAYTLEYENTAPASFDVEILVASGTGWRSDGVEKMKVEVKRAE